MPISLSRHIIGSADSFLDQLRHLGRVRRHADALRLEGLLLALGRAGRAGDDRARVTHLLPRRRLEAGDVADDRGRHSGGDEVGRLLLLAPADLTDHHDEVRLGVRLEAAEDVDERAADHRVAPDPHDAALTDAALRERLGDLVGQGPAAADQPDPAGLEDLRRHDADGRLPGADDARAVRADEGLVPAPEMGVDPHHVVCRNALRDADDEVDAALDRLVERVGGEAGRDEDHRGVRVGLADRVGDRVEDRDAVDALPGLARRHARDDVRAVRLVARGVEGALAPRDALDHEARAAVDEDAHAASFARATARSAADSIVCSTTTLDGARSAMMRRPSSSFVPSRRTTMGMDVPSRSIAVSRPSATSSLRVMPPKMLMSSTRTLGSESRTSSAVTTSSAFEPPPASRKLAGRPPARATTSSVLMTRPAPLPRMPTSPSSFTYVTPRSAAICSWGSAASTSRRAARSGWR